jgi:two-component system invasion response regulator UvrY
LTKQVRVLIADDHPLTRDGIRAALSDDSGIDVVAEATNGEEAVKLAGDVHPDVILMDVRMPGLGGIAATREITRTVPAPACSS